MQGKVDFIIKDKDGRIKTRINKHNRITELGKIACLARGLTGLADYCNVAGNNFYSQPEAGYANTKSSTQVGKILLLDKAANTIDSLYIENSSEIIGHASNAAAATTDPKEGFRVLDVNTTGTPGPVANAVRFKYTWTGISGDIRTVAMSAPPFVATHVLSPDNTGNNLFTKMKPESFDNVPAGCIGLFSTNESKAMQLDTLAMEDVVAGSDVTAFEAMKGFVYGNYHIFYGDNNYTYVYNTVTGVHYKQSLAAIDFFYYNNELWCSYAASLSKYYAKVTAVTDEAITLSSSQTSPINSAWSSYKFTPLSNGLNLAIYYYSTSTCNIYIVSDVSAGLSSAVLLWNETNNNILRPYGLLDCIMFYADTSGIFGCSGYAVSPAGQWGNILSVFDLEDTYTVAATDTVLVEYTYTLED